MIAEGITWFFLWLFAQGVFHKLSAPRYYQQLMGRYVGAAVGNRAPIAVALLAMSTMQSGSMDGWAVIESAMVALAAIVVYQISGQIIRHAQWMEGGD